MIKDRGNIKWTAMMLPEHVSLLREIKEELNQKQKPELDEQQLMEMNEVICEGMAENQAIAFTYYRKYDYHCVIGKVHYYSETEKKLYIIDHFGGKTILLLEDIIHVQQMTEEK